MSDDHLITQALAGLKSEKCVCGAPKQKRVSLCMKCYLSLPRDVRYELYRAIADGYPDYYARALEYLKENTTRLRPKPFGEVSQ